MANTVGNSILGKRARVNRSPWAGQATLTTINLVKLVLTPAGALAEDVQVCVYSGRGGLAGLSISPGPINTYKLS